MQPIFQMLRNPSVGEACFQDYPYVIASLCEFPNYAAAYEVSVLSFLTIPDNGTVHHPGDYKCQLLECEEQDYGAEGGELET